VERPEDIVGSSFVFVQVWSGSVSVATWFDMPWNGRNTSLDTFVFVQVWLGSLSVATWFDMPWKGRKTSLDQL
jgi:hypothetical protein